MFGGDEVMDFPTDSSCYEGEEKGSFKQIDNDDMSERMTEELEQKDRGPDETPEGMAVGTVSWKRGTKQENNEKTRLAGEAFCIEVMRTNTGSAPICVLF